jgi:hypothetical protein
LAAASGLPGTTCPCWTAPATRGHGRIELRTPKAVSVGRFGFPHAAQVLQVTRKSRDLDASPQRFTTVTVYAVTGPPFAQAQRRHARDPRRALTTLGIRSG